jgi:hypothetical protein
MNQTDEMSQIPAMRREMLDYKTRPAFLLGTRRSDQMLSKIQFSETLFWTRVLSPPFLCRQAASG